VKFCAFLAAAVLAAALPTIAAAQDKARGETLAVGRCTACHGENGRSHLQHIPSLAGQQPLFIVTQLILMREGIRQVPAMQAFVQGIADQDVEDLAAYYTSLPAGPAEDRSPRDAALATRGEVVMGPRHCTVCHLPTLHGQEQVPRITGQREEFLARTLAAYRDGNRVGADPQMNDTVRGLPDADIAAVAHYLAHRD
jgi:cytochrome c553